MRPRRHDVMDLHHDDPDGEDDDVVEPKRARLIDSDPTVRGCQRAKVGLSLKGSMFLLPTKY